MSMGGACAFYVNHLSMHHPKKIKGRETSDGVVYPRPLPRVPPLDIPVHNEVSLTRRCRLHASDGCLSKR